MLPPLSPPDYFARSSLPRFAHSALPDAPVRPPAQRASRIRRTTAAVRRGAGTTVRRARGR